MIKIHIIQKLFYVKRLKKRFYNWSRTKLEKHQQNRLRKIISFTRRNSSYYKQLFPSEQPVSISDIPIMNKKTMMDNFNQIVTAELDRDSLIEYFLNQEKTGDYSKYQGKYSVGLSSGTSGNKSLTILSKKESDLYNCLLYARNGIPKNVQQKRILFALRRYNPTFMEVSSFGIHLVYIDYTLTGKEMVDLINSKNLNVLAGPPSLLEIIARLYDEINHKIDAIISYAEVLSDFAKNKLEDIFKAPVVQIYQGSEGFIASTCKNGNLHLNEDVLFFEFEKLENHFGLAKNIILTDLYRTTQPILRYQMDDILEMSSEPCECGSCFQVIEKIQGRKDDVFHLKNNEGEIRFLFPDYIRRAINQASDQILEYQAIQKSPELIEIRLILSDKSDRIKIIKTIMNNLKSWAKKLGANLGVVEFSDREPEKNPVSKKLIRVQRRF
ncbi:MAG: hypothetical protein GF308_11310 [Candidatus Heimdallarchaeota archaeon]|nr:hypothetical protein [Candidatus Heimdallarchaeota archaeon]